MVVVELKRKPDRQGRDKDLPWKLLRRDTVAAPLGRGAYLVGPERPMVQLIPFLQYL